MSPRSAFPPLLAALLAATAFAHAQSPTPPLIPQPRELHPTATLPIPTGLRITCTPCFTNAEANFAAEDLTQSLAARHIPTNGPITITLTLTGSSNTLPANLQPQGYTITPGPSSLTLTAANPTGLFYAAQTLKQLITGDASQAVLHLAEVRDWPAMPWRGVQDDLSRGPIPTLDFQKRLIRTLAAYKINVYSPYYEHTQQYASAPLFAPPGGSISAADARDLVAYAARYHVTVVPEQESFGHLHKNLIWEQYAPLAETPHGSVLAPGQPGSLQLIDSMFTELAQLYPGPFLHIGADETQDLGTGQTKADVDARTLGPVYLDFLQKIVASLAPLHRKLLFWGDIAQSVSESNPDILKNRPQSFKTATIAVPWEYNPQPTRGFSRFLTPFTTAGFETWVAPGINNWSRVYPDWNDALPNIENFVAEGQRQGSTGVLNTVWYDDGEALASNNWFGLLFGAAASWQQGSASPSVFEHAYGEVFHGDQTGDLDQAQLELMTCHQLLRDAHVGDGSDGLFWMDPWSKDGQTLAAKLRPTLSELRLHAERALTLIAQARAAAPPFPSAINPSTPGPTAEHEDQTPENSIPFVSATEALPSNPTSLRNPDAIDALELGARRLDLIGLNFQLTDEIVQDYARAQSALGSPNPKIRATVLTSLVDIDSFIGRIRDLRDTFALLRDLYAQSWLRTNRPYDLRPILDHYDAVIELWQSRADRVRSAQRQYQETRTLPPAAELGLPPAPLTR